MRKVLPIAYCASAFRAATPEEARANVRRARALCKYALLEGFTPYAPHLLLTQFLADEDQVQRELGINAGSDVMRHCEAFFVCEEDLKTSAGARAELDLAEFCYELLIFRVSRAELDAVEFTGSDVWE
ncbi:MAG: hypothetical protein IPK72_21200 [Candidatus Eisenbacteria bacterium]|nr:hypothetical protein [Candidatus Eisenbacteria bacterium]